MTIGLMGRKRGMTRVFTDAGESIPVTVIEALPNRVTQVKTAETDGYRSVQVAFGSRKPSRLGKPLAGHYGKAKVEPGEALVEFRLESSEGAELAPGSELKVDVFSAGQVVDVTGTTIGKGFAGTMKRHNFAGGMASHGNSLSHRAPGSIGQRQTPGRVFPGQAHVGPHGLGAPHDREPARGRGRQHTQPAADSRRRAGLPGRPGDRSSLVKAGRRAKRVKQQPVAKQSAKK
jgi:large subunit ribosomal protein L3